MSAHPILTGLLQWLGMLIGSWLLLIPALIVLVWVLFAQMLREEQ
jgi:protein-S-isoprenylcysteine O-methyltransferase Ste14